MWVFLLFSSAISSCVKTNYFTECLDDLTQDIIVSGSDCGEDYPKIFKSQDCTFTCNPGTYLDISNNELTCSECPSGSFSIGGGLIYGGDGHLWDKSLSKFIRECSIRSEDKDYFNINCTSWEIFNNILISGQSTTNNTYTSGLSLSFKIVKPGEFTLTYRKDTTRVNGKKVGFLSVFINLRQVYFDNNIEESTWKTMTQNLEPGNYEVFIEYLTLRSASNPNPHAYISEIKVTGTEFASKYCLPCLRGGNKPGSSLCNLCDFNEYWDGNFCQDCPEDKYSIKGAVGENSCKDREICSEHDYKHVYSECVNDMRNTSFQWKQPVLCDYKNYELPKGEQGLPCESCKDGFIKEKIGNITKCIPCNDGMYVNKDNKCVKCPAGTYGWRSYNISDWTELPTNFSTSCLTLSGNPCLTSSGWIPNTYFISADSNHDPHSEFFLSLKISIEGNSGTLKFIYEFINYLSGIIDIYIDGSLLDSLNNQGLQAYSLNLTTGDHIIEWVYWSNITSSEELRIYSIKIQGSYEGGSKRCLICPDGTYSKEGSSICSQCSEGYTSNKESTDCVLCKENYYSPNKGSKCYKCPPGTDSNNNKTNCKAIDYAYLNDEAYYLANISGVGGKEGVYTYGICNMLSSKLYCHQTFYGPLPGENKDFYISVLNPALLSLPSTSYYFDPKTAFAYVVMDKKSLSYFKEQTSDICHNDKAIVSLGTIISGVNYLYNGALKIDYSQGDICDKHKNKYNSTLILKCDKASGIGWPSFNKSNYCSYEFLWKSKYGCPICTYDQMATIKSSCENGKRMFKKIEGPGCIIPIEDDIEWYESCSESIYKTWPMILAILITGILIIASIISSIIYRKYHIGYSLLANQSGGSEIN
ncbi:hypothetical protein SteCoe_1663 [Stentor coeruleus]|uniref:MRH domain-containing protein n=1 Tax=Stentor coeruleus TaxID=5963 RepID=A0A1R2D1N7_9CILI|nr:hypothetical protein SteCoe_1663 [Stentor coeruleus]